MFHASLSTNTVHLTSQCAALYDGTTNSNTDGDNAIHIFLKSYLREMYVTPETETSIQPHKIMSANLILILMNLNGLKTSV